MSLPGGYKILEEGYELRGSVESGMSATIPFIMPWELAFAFIGQLLPAPQAVTLNSITWNAPYQFPLSINGKVVPLYAQSYRCVPKGYNGTPASAQGLGPGDYFESALITVEFETPHYSQVLADDPNGFNQLDPANPLTYCEQSIQMTSKMVTAKGNSYKFTSGSMAGKPVPSEFGLLRPEAKLVLKFPKIPVLPWQLFQPYIGKINGDAMLNCAAGSLLLEGSTTVVTPGTDGTMGQNLGLMFAFNPDPTGNSLTGMSWCNQPIPDGSGYAPIASTSGSNPPYYSVDFRQIFVTLLTGLYGG